MDIKSLEEKLQVLGVRNSYYSLYGDLKPDSIILYQNYRKWEVFYLDERGGRHPMGIFDNENDACVFIYNELDDTVKWAKEKDINL
jgi:hypothetical protein